MPTDTVSIADFIAENSIKVINTERVSRNPNMDDSAMDHYKLTLVRVIPKGYSPRLTIYFSKGYGHKGRWPEADEVLDCLAGDSANVENARDFADFASELGYDEDSRKAEKIYKTCLHQAKRLKNFLGDDLYQQLLWKTERA